MLYRVKAHVWNMDLTVHKSYTIGRVTFYPNQQVKDKWSDLGHTGQNMEVGLASVDVEATDSSAAVRAAVDILFDYHVLLSWGHGRYVGFWPYDCYTLIDGVEKLQGQVSMSQRTGDPDGIGVIFGFGRSVEEFLKIAHPLIIDSNFNEKTRVKDALEFQLESEVMAETFAEAKFILSWTALEILGTAHARTNNYPDLLNEDEYSRMRKGFDEMMRSMSIEPEERRKRLASFVEQAKQEPIRQVISRFLSDLRIGPYEKELRDFYRLRNDVVHGNPLTSYTGAVRVESLLKLQRLVDKVLLKVLGLYDKQFIHGAYIRDDLRANS